MLGKVSTILAIALSILTPHLIYASTVGESLGRGFYSRIHDNIDGTIDTLRKKELSKFSTFAGFGQCRPPLPWLDIQPMDERLLIDLQDGNLSQLTAIMSKNKVIGNSDTESLLNLTSCLVQTYQRMGQIATKDENALASAGILGIYTDGDTTNSDYDILADIEKINAIIFTERLDYKGSINTARSSYQDLANGASIRPLTDTSDIGGSTDISGEDGADTLTTLASLGLGDQCTPDQSISSVSNIADAGFVSELDRVLAGGNPSSAGASYGPIDRMDTAQSSNEDFYHTPPCTSNFCIRVKTTPGSIGLVGGSSYSIESLMDKHTAIMTPIANSNLTAQRFSTQSYQPLNMGLIFKNIIPKVLSIEQRPQMKRQYREENTQERLDAEFEEMRRCAYIAAGLPSERSRANIISGAGYQLDTNSNTDNIRNKQKTLGGINTEESMIASCMDIAGGRARSRYYESLSTDLTELEVFTSALVDMLASGTEEHKALDKKKVY